MESDFFDYSKNDPKWNCRKFVHKISAGAEKETNKQIIVSTWQSVYKLPREWFDQFDAVIFDECHHLGAAHFSRALLKVQTRHMLGLSATPLRDDGLTKVFEWFT
jgi:superfamily II DNA or RNA helicase